MSNCCGNYFRHHCSLWVKRNTVLWEAWFRKCSYTGECWEILGITQSKFDECRSDGFSLAYNRPTDVKQWTPNLTFRGVGNEIMLWNKVMKELKLKHYAEPFKEIPFENFIQTPIGLMQKTMVKIPDISFVIEGQKRNQQMPTCQKISVKLWSRFQSGMKLCMKVS